MAAEMKNRLQDGHHGLGIAFKRLFKDSSISRVTESVMVLSIFSMRMTVKPFIILHMESSMVKPAIFAPPRVTIRASNSRAPSSVAVISPMVSFSEKDHRSLPGRKRDAGQNPERRPDRYDCSVLPKDIRL